MSVFYLNDKPYTICDDGKFRIQLGRVDRAGKVRYRTHFTSSGFVVSVRRFEGYNPSREYIKRLSYNISAYSPYRELLKIRGS